MAEKLCKHNKADNATKWQCASLLFRLANCWQVCVCARGSAAGRAIQQIYGRCVRCKFVERNICRMFVHLLLFLFVSLPIAVAESICHIFFVLGIFCVRRRRAAVDFSRVSKKPTRLQVFKQAGGALRSKWNGEKFTTHRRHILFSSSREQNKQCVTRRRPGEQSRRTKRAQPDFSNINIWPVPPRPNIFVYKCVRCRMAVCASSFYFMVFKNICARLQFPRQFYLSVFGFFCYGFCYFSCVHFMRFQHRNGVFNVRIPTKKWDLLV